VAAGATVETVDAVFDWIWGQGHAGDSLEALAPLAAALGVDPAAIGSDATKAALRANTEAAIAGGVYGVPTLVFDGSMFWGNDAHAFALAALHDPGVLDDPEMRRVGALPAAVQRQA
jgi:2-hydroxychromene-2-carboxylate isomerase